MSKTKRIKVDFEDTAEILELMLILKDVATTRFQHSAKRKQILIDFVGYFTDFFQMISLVDANSPIVRPTTDATTVMGITSESAFMGDMNSRMVRVMFSEAEKCNTREYIVVGNKAADKVKAMAGRTAHVAVFGNIEQTGAYKIAGLVKDHIVQKVMKGEIGRVLVVFPFALNINIIKPRTAVLFPSTEFFDSQEAKKQKSVEITEPVIIESRKDDVIGYLASLWLICRIYELMMNAECAGYAAQVQQLDAAADRLKKEKLVLGVMFKKSRKADISKSLSEVFASRMVNA